MRLIAFATASSFHHHQMSCVRKSIRAHPARLAAYIFNEHFIFKHRRRRFLENIVETSFNWIPANQHPKHPPICLIVPGAERPTGLMVINACGDFHHDSTRARLTARGSPDPPNQSTVKVKGVVVFAHPSNRSKHTLPNKIHTVSASERIFNRNERTNKVLSRASRTESRRLM